MCESGHLRRRSQSQRAHVMRRLRTLTPSVKAQRTHQSSTHAPLVQLVMTSSVAAAALPLGDTSSRPRAGASSCGAKDFDHCYADGPWCFLNRMTRDCGLTGRSQDAPCRRRHGYGYSRARTHRRHRSLTGRVHLHHMTEPPLRKTSGVRRSTHSTVHSGDTSSCACGSSPHLLHGCHAPHPDCLLCSHCHLLCRCGWDPARRESVDTYARNVAALCQVKGREAGAMREAGGRQHHLSATLHFPSCAHEAGLHVRGKLSKAIQQICRITARCIR